MRCLLALSLVLGAVGGGRRECGGVMEGSGGRVESPGYPDGYPRGAECVWTVVANGPIRLTFDDFALDAKSACLDEYVEIRDEDSRWTFCGEKNPGTDV
ncbi:unnamed protein product [Darwinula stevensoni]|uniref:CUB domain-containing protein n=1 Tax=Darwinula stevensoni TaxID=69355 RepID=A0A7R9AGE6_9CRUS|nr:unnamed protein product [Darwinula stevensoni]CAG0903588.1 unnamed protein product [Darwinula stevensoni]